MASHDLRYLANCTMLFTELPLLERPAAARAAGFDTIEFWWPWPEQPIPSDRDVEDFVAAVQNAGVRLAGLNFFGGDLVGPDCGVLSIPSRARQFRDNIDVAIGIGERLGTGVFNALYGNRVDEATPQQQDEVGTESLVIAAQAADEIGASVLVEPMSGPKPYPLRTAADAVAVVDRTRAAGVHNVEFLLDVFHLANNGDDLDAAIREHVDAVGHVQVADYPGRGEPGTGDLDLDRYLSDLQSAGYTGYVSLEYTPSTTTDDSLAWLPRERRSTAR